MKSLPSIAKDRFSFCWSLSVNWHFRITRETLTVLYQPQNLPRQLQSAFGSLSNGGNQGTEL